MTGIGSQFGQFGQSGGGISPYGYGASSIGNPFLQTPQLLQSLQQLPFGYGQQTQAFAQPLQQLMQILPQQLWQLNQLNQLLQHHVHGLQQLVQVVPQQLQQIQQVLQTLPQQIQQLQAQQPPFGAQSIPAIGAYGPWQQLGVGTGAPGFTGQSGPVM
jgi:hypothetical protein